MNNRRKIRESQDVMIYKELMRVLGSYTSSFPATGIDGLFDMVIEQGKKILPKDKQALAIIDYVLSDGSDAGIVQKLLNVRFSSLPASCRPITKKGNKHEVAFWERDGKVSDQVKHLIDFEATGKNGRWVDVNGDSVTLIDIGKE